MDWGVASRALAGQSASGDGYVALPIPSGYLLGVIDGLGHGGVAAAATARCRATIEAGAGSSLATIVPRCHEDLKDTRGVALGLAVFDAAHEVLRWIAVGSVEGVLVPGVREGSRRRLRLLTRNGVVGFRLPPLQESAAPLEPGDTLVIVSDGIAFGFEEAISTEAPPQATAKVILDRFASTFDDAMVVVARYEGRAR